MKVNFGKKKPFFVDILSK